jgi:hypothetical protein
MFQELPARANEVFVQDTFIPIFVVLMGCLLGLHITVVIFRGLTKNL